MNQQVTNGNWRRGAESNRRIKVLQDLSQSPSAPNQISNLGQQTRPNDPANVPARRKKPPTAEPVTVCESPLRRVTIERSEDGAFLVRVHERLSPNVDSWMERNIEMTAEEIHCLESSRKATTKLGYERGALAGLKPGSREYKRMWSRLRYRHDPLFRELRKAESRRARESRAARRRGGIDE